MGLDIVAYSHLEARPVPTQYLPKRIKKTLDLRQLIQDCKTSSVTPVEALALMGVTLPKGHTSSILVLPDEFEFPEGAREWNSKEKPAGVDWEKGVIYYRTENTKEDAVYGSYSGMGDLRRSILKTAEFLEIDLYLPMPNEGIFYDPPRFAQTVEQLRQIFPIWTAAHSLKCTDLHCATLEEVSTDYTVAATSEFCWKQVQFAGIYRCFLLASQNGLLHFF